MQFAMSRARNSRMTYGNGETIGHDSGREIVTILVKNPKKDPSKNEQDDINHMRKVVAYCKRHLAQEEKAKQYTKIKSHKSEEFGYGVQKA
jgi:hemerythrin